MTKAKILKVLRSGAVASLIASIGSAALGLVGVLSPNHAIIATMLGTLLATLSKSLPQLILELMDDTDVNLGQGGQSSVGTEVPK